MVYEITATVGEEDKHTADVSVLYFRNGKLFSGGNDGKIKVSFKSASIKQNLYECRGFMTKNSRKYNTYRACAYFTVHLKLLEMPQF